MLGPNVEAQLVFDGEHDNFVLSREPYFPMDHVHPMIDGVDPTHFFFAIPSSPRSFFHACGAVTVKALALSIAFASHTTL